MPYYAHTKTDPITGQVARIEDWEPLYLPGCLGNPAQCKTEQKHEGDCGHLNGVAFLAETYAREMFPPGTPAAKTAAEWGRLLGLWHDLGKYSERFQNYLKAATAKADPHTAETEGGPTGKVDHSTAGAKFTADKAPFGPLLSYLIAGHHAGLADGASLFHDRLKKEIPEWEAAARSHGLPGSAGIPPLLSRDSALCATTGMPGLAFLTRMFFSCLVDADFLATENFMNPVQAALRPSWPEDILPRMLQALDRHFAARFGGSDSPVNRAREEVRLACQTAAEWPPGFFSLTVPTGGGKTLSSLAFALRHALKHGLRRVIYVIPFTSIIEQNTDVFREVFAGLSRELKRDVVIEHHSNLDPVKETTPSRLAAENWDAPLVVTTNVQFFESFFANRSKACRKLHRIARSVVIFDEAQALPVALLAPILQALRCLVKDCQATAVLCTATQPALEKRDDFTVGISREDIREIIPDPLALFQTLRRTRSHHLGKLDDEALLEEIQSRAGAGCLLIVNTTKAAQELHAKLAPITALHLSARMCPAHRTEVLAEAKRLAEEKQPIVLVSTQLIEAGVDISFPAVFRAECGLDSFAQAAGRCNRNGELADENGEAVLGDVFLFSPVDHPIPKRLSELCTAAGITHTHILEAFPEDRLLSLEAVKAYFEMAIWQAGPKTNQWDEPGIFSGANPFFPSGGAPSLLQAFQYKSAAEAFKMIPQATHPIIIPWGKKGKSLAKVMRKRAQLKLPALRRHYRLAQRYTVQVYDQEWQELQKKVDSLYDGSFCFLIHPDNDYDKQTGLKRQGSQNDPNSFVCG